MLLPQASIRPRFRVLVEEDYFLPDQYVVEEELTSTDDPDASSRTINTTFSAILGPSQYEEFIASYDRSVPWVKHTGCWAGLRELLTWPQLNDLLFNLSDANRIRLSHNDMEIPPGRYLNRLGLRGLANDKGKGRIAISTRGMMRVLSEGATLILERLDEIHAPARALAAAIEDALAEPVSLNLYATLTCTPAFSDHFDDHDIIVLPLAGEKRWTISHPARTYPAPYDIVHTRSGGGPLWRKVDMKPGDFLYLPKGWWHRVVTRGAPSMHLSISIPRTTGLDVLEVIKAKLLANDAFRRDCPSPFDRRTEKEYWNSLATAIASVLSAMDLGQYRRFVARRRVTHPPLSLPATGLSSAPDALPPAHQMAWRVQPEVVRWGDKHLLVSHGLAWEIDADYVDTTTSLLAPASSDISQSCATTNGTRQRELIAALLREGLLYAKPERSDDRTMSTTHGDNTTSDFARASPAG